MARNKTTLFVTYDEDSVTNRRTRLPSQLNSVHLLEHCFVVTKSGLDITNRKRLHFKGSTLGDTVGPVAIPATEDVWQETFANKKLLFGAARVAVGGRDGMSMKEVQDEDEEIEGVKKVKDVKEKKAFVRNDADMEPVCFHGHGQHLTEEVMHTLAKRELIKGVVDLTPGDGELAHLCITKRIPYIGFPLTDTHMIRLMGHLRSRVWKDVKTEGSEMYEVGLVEIMGQAEKNETEGQEGQEGQEGLGDGAGRGRGRARGRGGRGRGNKSNPEADPSKTKAQGKTVTAKRIKSKANANFDDGGEDPAAEEPEDSNDGGDDL